MLCLRRLRARSERRPLMRPFKNKFRGQNLLGNISCKKDKPGEPTKIHLQESRSCGTSQSLLFLPLWSGFTGWKALGCLFRVAHHKESGSGERRCPHPKLLGASLQEERQVSEALGPAEGIKLGQSPAKPESGPPGRHS